MLNKNDRDRLKVLHEVEQKHLTQREAGQQLGLSERWVRKLLARIRQGGDAGVIHRLRGQPSNRRIAGKERQKAVKLITAKYGDFGPTLGAEYLAEKHGVRVSKETLRQWLIEAGLWKVRRRRVEEVHVWRPRRSCWGELVQWDTSEHDWLEGRGPKLYLAAMIDDATSQALARFVEHDSTQENLRLLGSYLKRFGRPVEFYTDRGGLFCVNQGRRHDADEAWEEARTQIGRALKELGIGWIAAHSPQAKGRIEWFFGTAQDRLVKGLRLAGASTREAANNYLERKYLPLWNQRFVVEPAKAINAHRPLLPEQRSGRHSEPCGGAHGGKRLHAALRRAVLPDRSGRHPAGAARWSGAGGEAAGRQRPGAIPGALPGHNVVRGETPASSERSDAQESANAAKGQDS